MCKMSVRGKLGGYLFVCVNQEFVEMRGGEG